MMPSLLTTAWRVFRKELLDALRDRRTLLMVALSSVCMGPVILSALSGLLASFEERAEKRELWTVNMAHAPTLQNYLLRQSYHIKDAPPDYEEQIKKSILSDPVVVIDPDFEQKLAEAESPKIEIVSSSGNQRAQAGVSRISKLLRGFGNEQSVLRLSLHGVAPSLLLATELRERDLASKQSRAAQLTGTLPFFIIMAVMYGLLAAALDTTAGERERGSLEPLLMNPAPHSALVLGKWGAASCVGLLVATLSSLSFLPAQLLIRSDNLAALFQYGAKECLWFVVLLIPLALLLAAVVMAVAIRCKTFKEAQSNSTVVVMFVSLVPTLTLFNPGAEQPWHIWVPGLSQNSAMTHVIKGEALTASQVVIPWLVTLVLCAICLRFVTQTLQHALRNQ